MATKKASTPSDEAPVLPPPQPENSVEEFLEKHGKKTGLLVILLVIAAAVGFFMKAQQKTYLKESGESFASAQTTEELRAVINEYPKSVAAGNAQLLLADRQLTNGQIEEAKISLTQFVKDQKDTPLYFNGLFALGTVHEKLGDLDAAKKTYQEIINAGDKASTAAAAALRMADIIHGKGDLEDALKAYDTVAQKFPGNVFMEENGVIDSRKADANQSITLRDNPPPAPEPKPKPEPPAKPAAPAEKTEPAAPAEKTEPAAPAEKTEPAAPAEKTEPAAPAEKTEPAAPAEKTEPAAPAEKTEPAAPAAPNSPE
ncbi:MAG: tetratricopeptide repeat protein [Verrucomicrobiaceae bacterium]|nr:tetratricopeptide repeat protein [Verrucomicrobiaceae bacterium]